MPTCRYHLPPDQSRIGEIKQQFGGTKVAATESIFEFLANATGLDLVSPRRLLMQWQKGTIHRQTVLCNLRTTSRTIM